MRVVFPYLAQAHQLLPSLPIAAALAERHPGVEVRIAATREDLLEPARRLAARHALRASLSFDRLALGPGDHLRMAPGLGRTPFKKFTLLANRRHFAGFHAVVTPERTSLFLRRLGVPAQSIWTRHGAGDRKIGFAPDVRGFHFVLMAGRNIERRLLKTSLILQSRYATGAFACRPRPCVFLDAHDTSWQGDPNYRSWTLGPALRSAEGVEAELDRAFVRHADYTEVQRRYFDETVDLGPGPTTPRGADAIPAFMATRFESLRSPAGVSL